MAIFGPKPWVNRFRKMSIFRLFELVVFIAQKGVFSFYNIVKDVFLAHIAPPKKLEKWPFLDQNLWKNVNFSTLKSSCFYSLGKRFFVLEYRKRHFPGLCCVKKKKVGKKAIFGPKPWLTPLEKCQFLDFLNLFFLQLRKAFFRSRIS